MKTNLFLGVFIFLIAVGCSTSDPLVTVTVSETQGLDRELEYVSTEIPLPSPFNAGEYLYATERESGTSIPVQILDTVTKGAEALQILFPVNLQANDSKTYQIGMGQKRDIPLQKTIDYSEDTTSVENDIYKAFFSTEDDKRGGQINGILLKEWEGQLLERGHIPMHWAPNFSKSDSNAYFNFEDLSASSKNGSSSGIYKIEKWRSGTTDSVPEIDLKGQYLFYADLPYFIFESTMVMNSEVELDLLRNDEMTMDSLFTHVVYQTKGGEIERLELYTEELDVLEESPIPDNADFVAFYHNEKKYGLGSIRLEYDTTDENGNPSPVHKPYTKISKSSGNGRYWNRVLSDTIQNFPQGSRYHEKNAYLIFRADDKVPEKEILYYKERLENPLTVTVDFPQ